MHCNSTTITMTNVCIPTYVTEFHCVPLQFTKILEKLIVYKLNRDDYKTTELNCMLHSVDDK